MTWFDLDARNPQVGKTVQEANLREHTGASVVAILRNRQLIANPKSHTVFEAGDHIGLIGDKEQIEAAQKILTESAFSDIGVEWET